jgi:hypothetical protein
VTPSGKNTVPLNSPGVEEVRFRVKWRESPSKRRVSLAVAGTGKNTVEAETLTFPTGILSKLNVPSCPVWTNCATGS